MRKIPGKELENVDCIGKISNLREYMKCHTTETGLEYEGIGGHCKIYSKEEIHESYIVGKVIGHKYIKWFEMERT